MKDEKMLAHEARQIARKMERKAERIKVAAEREYQQRMVIENNPDDTRGDMCSLMLNAKPAYMNEKQWQKEIEARGGPVAKTLRKWLNREVTNPQHQSCERLLRAIGMRYYYGRL